MDKCSRTPDPGDERHPLPAGGGKNAERMAAIDWVRQQLANAIPIAGTLAEQYLANPSTFARPMASLAPLGPGISSCIPTSRLILPFGRSGKSAGEIIGLHSIELDPRTGAEAETIEKPRLSRGPVGEGSVFLGDRLASAATLVIGEGLETTLTRSLIGLATLMRASGRYGSSSRHRTIRESKSWPTPISAMPLVGLRADTPSGRAAYVVTVPDSLGPKADLNDCALLVRRRRGADGDRGCRALHQRNGAARAVRFRLGNRF